MNGRAFSLYKIVNSINDKIYIGITSDPSRRLKQHKSDSSNCTKLKRAMLKYGPDNFSMEIICIGSEQYIIELEEKAITLYDSMMNGYNTMPGSAKSGNLTLPEEVKSKISESLNIYHSNNVAWNKGLVKGVLETDVPHYVMGFWFSSPRAACKALGIEASTFYKWRKEGTLGEEAHLSKDSLRVIPCYVAGVWFPSVYVAALTLNVKFDAIKKRIKDGAIEEALKKKGVSGAENHMSGKTGALHHNSQPVEVDGKVYESIADAALQTDYTKKMIYTRLKNNTPGFSRVSKDTN